MSEVRIGTTAVTTLQARMQEYQAQKAAQAAERIKTNIVAADRVDTGLMRDSTYSEQIGENRFRVGVRGPGYTIYQERGTRPREGNRGIEGAHFVEDAMRSLEAGDV